MLCFTCKQPEVTCGVQSEGISYVSGSANEHKSASSASTATPSIDYQSVDSGKVMNLVANIMTTWVAYKGFQTYALIVIDEPHEVIGHFTRASQI